MRSVRVNSNGPATQRLAEPDHHTRGDKRKQVRGGVTGEGQGLSEEDESRINGELVISDTVQQKPHPHSQGSLVCWEKFLPFRSLKVLLVENDDSTRHIVSALLRNCSYEVTAVSTGLEAWKIVHDLTNRIDLVLTEVVMPCLSGMALLHKIKNHKTCKNIPVIMMSSNDSMGIVFKCLSKGAVDFLVKPIRKNELKNLWQHVWRKCHSSSGSGSESGTRTLTSVKSKSLEESDGDTGRFDAQENANRDLNIRDGNRSDNGSGTQSSWTKRAVAVDSPQPTLTWDRLASSPDKTCAPLVPKNVATEYHRQVNEYGNDVMGRDLEMGEPSNTGFQAEHLADKENISASEPKEDGTEVRKEKIDLNSDTPNGELWKDADDEIVDITNCTNSQMVHKQTDVPNDASKENKKNTAIFNTTDAPSLELSLKRRRDVNDIETAAQDRNVLRHSNLSPFSRYKYNSSSTANQAPTGNVGSCSPLGNSSDAAKTEAMQNLQSSTNGTGNQPSNGSSNNNDMGSTTDNDYTKQTAFGDKPTPKSAINTHTSSAFQPIVNNQVSSSLHSLKPGRADAAIENSVQVPTTDMHEVQVQHHHHHYHHHHHHVHKAQQQKQVTGSNNLSLKTVAVASPQSGPSNLTSTPIEGNTADGSGSGSNNGSNGQKCSSTAVLTERIKASNDGVTGSCGVATGSGSGIDLNRFSRREAALNKFREKRKERCFDKKVRYQSRKKLAEQRPRVKGQFVRQNKSKDDDS